MYIYVCSYSINWLYPVCPEFVGVTKKTAALHYNLSNFFLDQGNAVTPVDLSEFIEEGDRKLNVLGKQLLDLPNLHGINHGTSKTRGVGFVL